MLENSGNKTRTFSVQSSFTYDNNKDNQPTPKNMSALQGVNRGQYAADLKSTVSTFSHEGYTWDMDNTDNKMRPLQTINFTLEALEDYTFVAHYETDRVPESAEGYSLKWYESLQSGMVDITTQAITIGNTSTLNYDESNADIIIYLYDGEKCIASRKVQISKLEVDLIDNGFPKPYTVKAAYKIQNQSAPFESVDIRVDLLKRKDGSIVRYWSSENKGSIEVEIPLTNYETVVRVTARPTGQQAAKQIVREYVIPNFIQFVNTITTNDPTKTNYKSLPHSAEIYITDKNGVKLDIDSVNYTWVIVNSGGTHLYQQSQTSFISSGITLSLPIPVKETALYFTATASHEDFITDMDVLASRKEFRGFLVPYDNYTATYTHGATMENTTGINDNVLSCKTNIIDNQQQKIEELYGLTFNFVLKDQHNESNKGKYVNITDNIIHEVEMVPEGNDFRFTFPYPYLKDLYFIMQVYDQYKQQHITHPVFNQFNLKTVPELKEYTTLVGGESEVVKYKYKVHLSAGGDINNDPKEHNVTAGLTFTWKLKDKATGIDIRIDNELTVDPTDPRIVSINKGAGSDRVLICEVSDYYENVVSVSIDIPGENLRIVMDANDSDLFHADTGGESGFTSFTWSVTDYYYNPYDISHLTITDQGLSATTIKVDKAVTPRVLMLSAFKDGREVFAAVPLTSLEYGIAREPDSGDRVYDPDKYMAKIAGSTTVLPDNFSFSWNINFDGIEEQNIVGNEFATSDMNHPKFNAVITLKITDAYSTVTSSARYIKQNKHLDLALTDDYLVATLEGTAPTDGSWQWYGINGDIVDGQCGYLIACTEPTMRIDESNDHYTNYMAVWTSEDRLTRVTGFYSPSKNVIYVFHKQNTIDRGGYEEMVATYADGHDNNSGRTPHTAVKSMSQAYNLLSSTGTTKENMIVVMGCLFDEDFLKPEPSKLRLSPPRYLPQPKYCKNATITGTYGDITQSGTLLIRQIQDGSGASTYTKNGCYLGGATVFDDIILSGLSPDPKDETQLIPGEGYIYCCLNDITFDKNVRMVDYADISPNDNGLGEYIAPKFHVIGGFYNYDNSHFTYPEGNQTKGRTTIRILSGSFGRIIAGGRNNGAFNVISNNICAHPQWPHRVDVEIDLKHINNMSDYAPDKDTPYKYDIGLLVGGQTDGSVFTDARLMVNSGTIGRFISGNISYGRKVAAGYPSDSFFGSTVITLKGGEIGELVGGTLGRNNGTNSTFTDQCESYFYGRSIINIEGGIVNDNIYGSGAGGVVGFGDDVNHTLDKCVPFYTGQVIGDFKEVSYGNYDAAKGKLPTMVVEDNDSKYLDYDSETGKYSILDFNKTYTEVNVTGGTINGHIYGGAFGYSKQVSKDKSKDYDKVNEQAGYIFGNTVVNIYGGTVRGNIYGGGAGSRIYYDDEMRKITGKTPDPDRLRVFSALASIFGDTNVEISGGVIEGNVFAGSQGIMGMPAMALVTGETNLTIRQELISENTWRTPIIDGEIYGGSNLGAIIGNTNVKIQGGVIGNSIFGGSKGITGEGSTITVVKGDTNVEITGGRFFTAADESKISNENLTDGADRQFNIYGGGDANCVIDGNTHVNITKSLFSSHLHLLEPLKYPSFQDCIDDITYRKFSVFGAGRGAMTDVTGNTWVDVNILEGGSVPSTIPIDVANEQQFITIAGGGFAGNVYGNTNVSISGNTFAREAYGGSMYGRIEGYASLNITGGSFHNVYGGGLLGDVMKGTYLTIGTRAEEDNAIEVASANRNIFIYNDVYGGNDVGGVVGYKREEREWRSSIIQSGGTSTEGEPYYIRRYTDNNTVQETYKYHIVDEDYGVNLRIFGGNILGSVYGVGNGNHTGYYVPNMAASEHHEAGFRRVQFTDGPAYLYQLDPAYPGNVGHNILESEQYKENWGLYLYRPRTARVRMHIGGNSDHDRVRIGKSVFGGGHSCTPGKFDPTKSVFTDPSRFLGGGTVKLNFGSYVNVTEAVYIGNSGDIIGKQTVSDGTKQTANFLESDYDYHYYDTATKQYCLGFPYSVEGRNRFHAYMRLIDMDAKTSLSFFNDPYPTETSETGSASTKTPYPKEFKDYAPDNYEYKEYQPGIPTPEPLEADNIRFGAFYAGGARGSMTYEPEDKGHCYHYILPEGLTVDTHVVGGSQDATVNFYKYSPDFITFDRDTPWFTYHGGVVYDINDGGQTGYGGGVVEWHIPSDHPQYQTERLVGDEMPRGERLVVELDVRCQFDPQLSSYTDEFGDTYEARYGGLIYGGCYNSGITNGSVKVISTGNLLGDHFVSQNNDYHDYMAWSSLRHNVGRVYGGGFGRDTGIRGRTNVVIGGEFRGFNVFGGGMRGDVSRGTNVIIKDNALVYNAVYGGSLKGNVGLDPLDGNIRNDNIGTYVTVISGSVDRIYGGSMMGNVYNGTHVRITDEDQILSGYDQIYFALEDTTPGAGTGSGTGTSSARKISSRAGEGEGNGTGNGTGNGEGTGTGNGEGTGTGTGNGEENGEYPDFLDTPNLVLQENERLVYDAIGKSDPSQFKRIFVGSIFGGNDVSGEIQQDRYTNLCTDIYISEQARACKQNYYQSVKATDVTETDANGNTKDCYYGGYPIVGNVYAAGNGNMGDYISGVTINTENHRYNGGTIHIANGNKADIDIWELGKIHAHIPDVAKSKITVRGGTIINLYGGGNMCTVTDENIINIAYNDTVARAAFPAARQNPLIWGILRMFHNPQRQEVTDIKGNSMVFTNQIFRVFGGNNLMDMDIQPLWELEKGNIGSLYSGGNFGRMLCMNLTLSVESVDLRIDHVYGGGRVGDIGSMKSASFYGATLNIINGYVGDVYGGNDVAGNVYRGTNVNIYGAISGNVYGSGNGNYIYYYDHDGTHTTESMKGRITEEYDERYGGRYFVLPPKEAYPGKFYGTTDEEKILAINSYRPNVDRAYLSIEGMDANNLVYVLGNVYCGGNSSTVLVPDTSAPNDIIFRLGSYAVLGGVFLGSNGEGLANAYNIVNLSSLNDIDMTKPNKLATLEGYNNEAVQSKMHYRDVPSLDSDLYPNILSMYMRAAEVTAVPEYEFDKDCQNAYIGNFTIGGNYGSMMLDQTINMELPYNLTLMGRVVGGCYNSMVSYGGISAMGGMTKPLKEGITDRLNLKIRSQFCPWRLLYDPEENYATLVYNRVDKDGNFVDDITAYEEEGTYYYPEGTGNVYGGCFSSGRTTGNINIDIYSDFLGYGIQDDGMLPKKKFDPAILYNNLQDRITAFTVTGAGYGPHSELIGDVRIRLLPSTGDMNPHKPKPDPGSGNGEGSGNEPGMGLSLLNDSNDGENSGNGESSGNGDGGVSDESETHFHPSVNQIFAGSHNGVHIGNSTTEIRDGLVFSSIYGGSRSAFKYGSSQVIVGYPQYYVCKQSGTFTLKRGDQISIVAQAQNETSGTKTYNTKEYNSFNADQTPVIRQKVSYYKGDIVAASVVDQIIGIESYDSENNLTVTPISHDETAGSGATTNHISNYFTHKRDLPGDLEYPATWDDIHINIGENSNMNNPDAPYYGGGAIYGGGRALNSTAVLYSGVATQLSYTEDNNPDGDKNSPMIGYGGNSTIIIGDNPANCAVNPSTGKPLYIDKGPDNEAIRDHISIATGRYVKAKLRPDQDKIGKYLLVKDGNKNSFVHQASGTPAEGEEYYEFQCDGGIYGDGRRTFVEKFRAVDIEGYGYADYSPQSAKLINTFQRMDLLSLKDCCLQLQGATDYATNSIDATIYSVARVGEMRMTSSLRGDLTPSTPVEDNLELTEKRSRNYMAFFEAVHYLGAIISNTPMAPDENDTDPLREGIYRGADGKRIMDASDLPFYGYTPPTSDPSSGDGDGNGDGESTGNGEVSGSRAGGEGDGEGTGNGNSTVNGTGSSTPELTGPVSYYQFKKLRVLDHDKYEATPLANQDEKAAYLLSYKKRNLATAPNMIGINNGCNLTVQNVFTTPTKGESQGLENNSFVDNIYYGPICGVVEVKLLTPALDEGGGYIYAYNIHSDKDPNTGAPAMETSGNFVYPAVVDSSTDNYIVDDCYPQSFYNIHAAEDEEAHYWYVTGHNYFYNATLTGYTYNEDINFYLNNDDNLLYLFGLDVSKANTLKVISIEWDEHEDEDYLCALTNDINDGKQHSRSQYELYLTIDKFTENTYTPENYGHAFLVRIPNGNNKDEDYAYGTDENGNFIVRNNYSNYEGDVPNNPTIGIRLRDTDKENQLPEFYKKHLSQPDEVIIKLQATDATDEETNTYTLRLKIVYLQGPYIAGRINVENCALPGEYIYANTSEVEMEMDESLTVTSKHWYLYPRIKNDELEEKYSWDESKEGRVDATEYIMENVIGDVNRLQLPARYYQNGWKVGYSIVVNGQDFPLQVKDHTTAQTTNGQESGSGSGEGTGSEKDSTGSVEDTNDQEYTKPSNMITVHNYHRMSTMASSIKNMTQFHNRYYPFDVDETITDIHPLNIGFNIDLDLVGGAMVYIEDDDDFAAFTRYVTYCNEVRRDEKGDVIYDPKYGSDVAMLVAQVLPGYNPNGYITGFTNQRTIEGYQDNEDVPYRNVKNPSGAQNIHFILTTDVKATDKCVPIEEFRGIFHGNGHNIYFDTSYAGQDFIDYNYGEIHDLGFTSSGGKDKPGDYTSVVKYNYGLVTNCFYYNYPSGHPESDADYSTNDYATLVGYNCTEEPDNSIKYEGKIINCYQNTNLSNTQDTDRNFKGGVRYYSNERFHNGLITYNLNREYLKARYRSHGLDNIVRASMLDDLGRTNLDDEDDSPNPPVNYLYDYYTDGSYRFGYVESEEHPEGRRLNENMGIPNYENRLGNELSMHISDDTRVHDERRWFTVEGMDRIIKRDTQGNILYDEHGEPLITNEGYFPIFIYDAQGQLAPHSDFIFFGQLKILGADRQYYPSSINSENRIYRAGGFYLSDTDYGFYFNRAITATVSDLTAIDFTGHRDLLYNDDPDPNNEDGTSIYAPGWNYYLTDRATMQPVTSDYVAMGTTLRREDILEDIAPANPEDPATKGIAQLIYYPPVLDLPGGEYKAFMSNITSFNIDSNTDIDHHNKITRNLLVYTPEIGDGENQLSEADNERLFKMLHYTRLRKLGDPDGETPQEEIIGHQLIETLVQVKDSKGNITPEYQFHAANGLFHLVDKQNFNAPIDFYVATVPDQVNQITGRAWYNRLPSHYSHRPGLLDPDKFNISKDAWESIALPFTANRVIAANSGDYNEKYSRGEISHFYGNDQEKGVILHDYWLRGLVDTNKDNYDHDDVVAFAKFARPGEKADNLFDPINIKNGSAQMRADYVYENNWFYQTYKNYAYNTNHNMYAEPIKFEGYRYLTKNAPYIVAYPSMDYYEFDLSGSFYNDKHQTTGCKPQEIIYEFSVDHIDDNNNFEGTDVSVRIPVTDNYEAVQHTKVISATDGTVTTHHATFSLKSGEDITDDMYVLNEKEYLVNIAGEDLTLLIGSAFINCKDFGITEILPFRTYLTVKLPGEGNGSRASRNADSRARFLQIAGVDGAEQYYFEEEEDPEEQLEPEEPQDQIQARLKVSVEGDILVIESPEDMELDLYNTLGQRIRHLKVYAGINRYRGIPSGVYIVASTKVYIKP